MGFNMILHKVRFDTERKDVIRISFVVKDMCS